MQTLETLKRNIKNADDLANVVRTMKTLAAVSIRQYETATESLNVYAQTIDTGLGMVLRRLKTADRNNGGSVDADIAAAPQITTACSVDTIADAAKLIPASHRFPSAGSYYSNDSTVELQEPTSGRTGAVVFGSDQGMCGQFNEQIAHFTAVSLSEATGRTPRMHPVLCVGHRVEDAIVIAGLQVECTFRLPGSAGGITSLVQDLLPAIDEWREAHDIVRILVFHNRRVSASGCRPDVMQLLPLNTSQLRNTAEEDTQTVSRSLPTWSMDTGILFSRLVKQFLFVSLFRACAESLAGENASRIAAMQAAERNIRDRLHDLRADYAARRQTTITEELLDVVTGFEALNPA